MNAAGPTLSRTPTPICSFECTFCLACADFRLGGRCPNRRS
ncbi:DUF1272 domain-containing protein [Kineococcus sp. SYSU DK003]